MKQVFQSLDDGTTAVVDVPAPQVAPGYVLIRTQASVISAGTERMLVDFGRANLLSKARQQPDKVRQVMDKVQTDGLAPTLQAVRTKLQQPIPLGYANAGVVLAVGAGVDEFSPGDIVASNGVHAEVVSVPRNLVVKVPDRGGAPLPPEEAAFAPIGSIALQGIRLAQPTLGERFVVIGLGLIGLLTVQLLHAQGCRVMGFDFDPRKVELASTMGARAVVVTDNTDPVAIAAGFAEGQGVDGVIVTASTKSSDPIHQAAEVCRKRGRIVLVGVTGLDLQRADFYEKELTFQVSCSYGPGRYEAAYEEKGQDYPIGFVRWTAGRNFAAFLDLVADGHVDVKNLATHSFPIDDAAEAYETLVQAGMVLGTTLTYPSSADLPDERLLDRHVSVRTATTRRSRGRVAVIGAGNYTQQVLLPALTATSAQLDTIVSQGGATAAQAARRFGFARASTDVDAVLADDRIDTVFVTTRHDTHVDLALRALRAGKHVYVEKPLALTHAGLDEVARTYNGLSEMAAAPPVLMVGFNRRFSSLTGHMHRLISSLRQPKVLIATVNAGHLPADHWTQDPHIGGGRIIGEGCHFIDLVRHLVGRTVRDATATYADTPTHDTATIQMSFHDGSTGTIHYLSTGSKAFPKERIEVFSGGRVLQLNNFRSLRGYGWPDFKRVKLRRQDKGHAAAVAAFVKSVQAGGPPPIALSELIEVSDLTLNVGPGAIPG